jgi:iron complex outermembrane receptor protein
LFIRFFFISLWASPIFLLAQSSDTVRNLETVTIEGYAYHRPASEVPSAIAVIGKKDFARFNNTSLLPALNQVAGVRMEERSPGSYRLSIRGSSLRSPFGIRNVKFYWNGLPVTDGGGNTYLNLFDNSSISKIEIIKGPGSSLYGAGTGGVILLTSTLPNESTIQAGISGGSYGLFNYQASANTTMNKLKLSLRFAHQQSDGYRQNTSMNRDALNVQLQLPITPKGILSANLFYTNLFYQTPGGLTQALYDQDPTLARPESIDKKASVYNKTFFGGVSYDYQWNKNWSTKLGGYGSLTDFTNPAILNYEKRKEENAGARTETQYEFEKKKWTGRITFGGEYQYFNSPISNYDNVKGNPGTLQFEDKLTSSMLIAFAQAEFNLPQNYFVTLGSSYSFVNYTFNRISVVPTVQQNRKFNPEVSPRIAVLKKINKNLSVYGTISKGFSPPTLAEVRPSTSNYNDTLKAETGISYELGMRGRLTEKLLFDVALYSLHLDQTIVVQRKLNNADYFINAGNTLQNGAEVMLTWIPISNADKNINTLKVWSSYTLNRYRFGSYVKNQLDYSGNQLTGVAPTILVSGVDVEVKEFYVRTTITYTDRIPLNDANTDFSSDYFLAGARLGYSRKINAKRSIDIWVGVDNALNQKYSLGNDLNAAAGRYFNAATNRNFYFGLNFSLAK